MLSAALSAGVVLAAVGMPSAGAATSELAVSTHLSRLSNHLSISVREPRLRFDRDHHARHERRVARGWVIGATAGTITIANGRGTRTLDVNASTVVTRHDRVVSMSSLAVGDFVLIRLAREASPTARTIDIVRGPEVRPVPSFRGQVIAVSGTSITVLNESGAMTFTINSSTAVTKFGQAAALADVLVGDHVRVASTSTGTASSINVFEQVYFNGVVTAVSGSSITISTPQGPLSFAIDASTVVTKFRQPATPADLVVGDHVHIVPATSSTAGLINVFQLVHFNGVVTALSGTSVTINSQSGPMTFAINSSTVVTKFHQPATEADLMVGDHVHIVPATSTTAATINIFQVPASTTVHGAVSVVASSSITVRTPSGAKTIGVNSATKVTKFGAPAALADVVVGDQVTVTLAMSGPATATLIAINAYQVPNTTGTLTAIATSSITVRAGSANVTFAVGSSTKITKLGAPATVADLAVGDRVVVTSSSSDFATAASINVTAVVSHYVRGDVTKVTSAWIMIRTTSGLATLGVSASTKVTKFGAPATPADVVVGDVVVVLLSSSNPAAADTIAIVAYNVPYTNGTVTALSATSLTVKNDSGSFTFALVSATTVTKLGVSVPASALAVGESVHVESTSTDLATAKLVAIL
jgi:Domain of unknown function (DUF5666)